MTSKPRELILLREHRALGVAAVLTAVALFAAFVLVLINQLHVESDQAKIRANEARIASLQLQVTQLAQEASKGQADRTQLQLLVQALARQVRHLGGTPQSIPPTLGSAGLLGTDGSASTPSTSTRSTPQPATTRGPQPQSSPSPRPSSRPTPTPSPTPTSICLTPRPVSPLIPPKICLASLGSASQEAVPWFVL